MFIYNSLTRIKRHLTEQYPSAGEVQLQLQVLPDSLMQLNSHVPRVLHHQVRHVREVNGFRTELVPVEAEKRSGMRKHLKLRSIVVINALYIYISLLAREISTKSEPRLNQFKLWHRENR